MFQSFNAPSKTDHTPQRIAVLRAAMEKANIDVFLVPRGDEHKGEYVAARSERLSWLTGFTGSAGLAVIGLERAVLFVDGRYTVQAQGQVPKKLFEIEEVTGPRTEDWLIEVLPDGGTVGFDPMLHSLAEIERATALLKPKKFKLKPVLHNLVDMIWGSDQPAPPRAPIVPHPVALAGRSADDKIANIQKALTAANQDAAVLTAPDSICWLLNIRGGDIPHTPVVLAFAIVPKRGKVELFLDPKRLDSETKAHIKGVARVRPPAAFKEQLVNLAKLKKTVRLDPLSCNWWIARQLGGPKKVARGTDPCLLPKAIKTKAEIRGMRKAHLRDGVAVCQFLAWLDREAPKGRVDEISAARQLESFRTNTGKLKEISFDTISGSGPHGAIVHYRVTERSNCKLCLGELYLVDSGAQYRDGTTDITRTIAIGEPSAEMRDRFTRVLKGHIAIATARFPKGSNGMTLDPMARHALWQGGFDFDHGTGHGVGSYLSVHEGPQSISKRGVAQIEPGMIISNEPGYYKQGAYGIRIENLVLVLPAKKTTDGDRAMLSFETLTLAPIDRRLVEPALLTMEEWAWLDNYHARVRDEIGPKLAPSDQRWLTTACRPL